MRILGLKVIEPASGRRLARLFGVLGGLVGLAWAVGVRMPGRSYHGPLPALSPAEAAVRDRLRTDLQHLAGDIGMRNLDLAPEKLAESADWLEAQFAAAGYRAERQWLPVRDARAPRTCNLSAELRGTSRPEQVWVLGAHYDSVDCAAANDNGSGVVALLALARYFAGRPQPQTLRFVAFTNEEPPRFWTSEMGSLVYARELRRQRVQVVGMWSLETLGWYSDEPGTQRYPLGLLKAWYPTTGNFVMFVGNLRQRGFVTRSVAGFRRVCEFPSEGIAGSSAIPGIGWSDHWSFWQCGYPALMITDTAPFRYPHYHQPADTPDKVDCERLARVTLGLARVLEATGGPAERRANR